MPRAGLGSHESRCRGGLEPAQPKVRHLDRHGVVDEEVQRFQVPVNDYGLGLVQDCRQAPMHAGMSRMHHQHGAIVRDPPTVHALSSIQRHAHTLYPR